MSQSDRDIIICRCEDLTLADIRALIEKGYRTLDEMRRISRLGMGPCQGRTCRALVQRELQSSGISIKEQKLSVFRPPIKPITLGSIAKGADRRSDHA